MIDGLQNWRDARQKLDDAIQNYLESTATLNPRFFGPNPELTEVKSLDDIALEVREDLNSMSHRLESLQKGQAILNRIRNRSESLVLTNRLPYEVLHRIFHFCAWRGSRPYYDTSSTCFDQHYTLKALFTLTHICADWRAMLVEAPSFWSHIEFKALSSSNPTNTSHRIQTVLERARDHPLCIDFDGRQPLVSASMSTMLRSDLLRPYVNNLQTIYIINRGSCDNFLEFLSIWPIHLQTSSIRSLMIRQEGSEPLELSWSHGEEHASYLAGIRVLRLNTVYFRWDSPIYRNLFHLQLGGVTHELSPTLQQMLAILSACLELHILLLTHMSIRPEDNARLRPVILEQVRTLELLDLSSESLRLLLPMLVPRSESLSVRIDFHPASSDTGCAFLAFLARNNVTRLFISTLGRQADGIVDYLATVPNLITLILDFSSCDGDLILAAITQSKMPLCPTLRALYLGDGVLQSQSIEDTVKAYPLIEKHRLTYCGLETSDEELIDRLTPLVQDVVVDDEGIDTNLSFYWYYFMY